MTEPIFDHVDDESHLERKGMLKRIVSMLTRLIGREDFVSEPSEQYNAAGEYEYRDAEYEYEEQPEPSDAAEDRWPVFTNGIATPGPR